MFSETTSRLSEAFQHSGRGRMTCTEIRFGNRCSLLKMASSRLKYAHFLIRSANICGRCRQTRVFGGQIVDSNLSCFLKSPNCCLVSRSGSEDNADVVDGFSSSDMVLPKYL